MAPRAEKKKCDYSKRVKKEVGRPPVAKATVQIILNIAEENEQWDCRTIAGDLQKLGHNISHSAVFNILKANGIPLDPERKALSWKKFIQSHMDVIWACDFFTEEVWSFKGLVTVYVLFFIHLGTRRVHIAVVTPYPKAVWMQQHARIFLMMAEDSRLECKYLIHAQDNAFLPFDFIIKTDGINAVKTPRCSPWCNAYAERFVREARETLGNLVPLDFDYSDEPAAPKQVRCDSDLGGLLNHYYVDQAA